MRDFFNQILWVWRNTVGVRLNMTVRIVIGVSQVLLGLLMVWLSKRFIDVTIRTGGSEEIVEMILWLVLTVMVSMSFGIILTSCKLPV